MSKVATPELDKMLKVQDENRIVVSFLEWLGEQEIVLARWFNPECDYCNEDRLLSMTETKEQLLARYYSIDLNKAEAERQALLDDLREQNEPTN